MLGVQLADVSTRCSSHPQGKKSRNNEDSFVDNLMLGVQLANFCPEDD